jgi:hypothetical protein
LRSATQILPSSVQTQLNLTAQQKRQVSELQQEVDRRLDQLLTNRQKQQLQLIQPAEGPAEMDTGPRAVVGSASAGRRPPSPPAPSSLPDVFPGEIPAFLLDEILGGGDYSMQELLDLIEAYLDTLPVTDGN